MFASIFLVTDTHDDAVVMPKRALSVESLSDTVFVVEHGQAVRRDIEIGYEESNVVEVLSGLRAGDRVIVVGQDGLTDGTPVQVLKGPGAKEMTAARSADESFERPPGQGHPKEAGGARPDFSKMPPPGN